MCFLERKQPMRLRASIFKGLFSLLLTFSVSTAICNEKYNIKKIREHFSDILLVVYFNHPFYKNIEFEKELYSPIFENIVFYGDRLKLEEPPEAGVHVDGKYDEFSIVYTKNGYYYARLMKKVIEDHPGYKGYLIMQDDVVVQFWHFLNLDKDKIWYGAKNPKSYTVYYGNREHPNSWFASDIGYKEVKKMLPCLTPLEKATMESNFGEHGFGMYYCDCFYIPGRLAKRVAELCVPLDRTWCDLTVTNILGCLDLLENWEYLPNLWKCFDTTGTYIRENYQPHYYWLHSQKYSDPVARDFVRSIFKEQFYNHLDEVR